MHLDFGEGVDKARIRVLLENSIDASLRAYLKNQSIV